MTTRSPFRYVPALDGVRALSVVAILLFHSPFLWAKGGFLGVSVFFTLSGFLITSLLLSERERTGRISLKGFWVRRARRLAPAVLVLFGLVAALLATGNLAQRDQTFGDAVATAGWSANWRFVLSEQSYGDLFSEPSPFQHMWSLAVEEQFYLFFPLLLLLLLGRRADGPRRRLAVVVVAFGIAASTFLLWQLFDPTAPQRAYFGTDSRMAEPFAGVLLALLLTRGGGVRELPVALRRALDVAAAGALAGLAYLVYSWGQYDHVLYHGGLLLVAGLSAVLLAGVSQPGSLLGRLLGAWPLAWLGRVSYGVYVFHWPVYLWLTPDRTGLDPYPLLALRCALVICLAGASYHLVEQPIRQAKGFRVSLALPAWANATVAAIAVLVLATNTISTPAERTKDVSASGLSPGTKHAAPGKARPGARKPALVAPSPAASPRPRTASRPIAGRTKVAPQRPATAEPRPTTNAPPRPAPKLRVAVVGDSLADNIGFGMESWAPDSGTVTARNFSVSGCPLALGGTRRFPNGQEMAVREECGWFFDKSSQRWREFTRFDPDVVVVHDGLNELVQRKLDSWDDYHKAGEKIFDDWMKYEIARALDAFSGNQTRELLLLNAVCADWDSMTYHWQGEFGDNIELNARVAALNRNYAALRAPRLQYVNFKAHLCPNGRYTSNVDGVSDGRYDGYHLTDDAAIALATRWLGPLCIDAARS